MRFSAISLLAFVSVILLSSCGKVKDPEFRRIAHMRVKSISFQQAVLAFDATYFNPNSFGVTVKEAAVDVTVDSLPLGRFVQPTEVAVAKNSEFSIPLEASVSFTDPVLLRRLPGKLGREVMVQAKGSVRVGKAGVFFTKDINYQGRHRLDENLLKNPAAAGFIPDMGNF